LILISERIKVYTVLFRVLVSVFAWSWFWLLNPYIVAHWSWENFLLHQFVEKILVFIVTGSGKRLSLQVLEYVLVGVRLGL
jgi:hypothetical protein